MGVIMPTQKKGTAALIIAMSGKKPGDGIDDSSMPEHDESEAEGRSACAEAILDILSDGGFGSSSSDSDSEVQKATKEAVRRTKADMLADALDDFMELSCPHCNHGKEEPKDEAPEEE